MAFTLRLPDPKFLWISCGICMNSCPTPVFWERWGSSIWIRFECRLEWEFQTPRQKGRENKAVNLSKRKGAYQKENTWKVSAEAVKSKITAGLSAITSHYFRKSWRIASMLRSETKSGSGSLTKGSSRQFPLISSYTWRAAHFWGAYHLSLRFLPYIIFAFPFCSINFVSKFTQE